jgi:hypothetical protein
VKSARKEGGTALLARRRQSRSSRIRELSVLFSLEARSFLCLLKHTPRTDERDGMAGGGGGGKSERYGLGEMSAHSRRRRLRLTSRKIRIS